MESLNWIERWERENIQQLEVIVARIRRLASGFAYLIFVAVRALIGAGLLMICAPRLVREIAPGEQPSEFDPHEAIRNGFPRV